MRKFLIKYLLRFSEHIIMVNISELTNKKVTKKELQLKLEVTEFSDGIEIFEVSKPIEFKGSLNLVDTIIYLDGIINTELKISCSRCLNKFNYIIENLEVHEKLTNNPENKDDDVIFINNDNLDITEIVENNIITSLPIKRLCSEDCKGLCSVCGTNLNYSTCKCEVTDIDPRLAKLKDMFSND